MALRMQLPADAGRCKSIEQLNGAEGAAAEDAADRIRMLYRPCNALYMP